MNIYQKIITRFSLRNGNHISAYDMIPSDHTSPSQILKIYRFIPASGESFTSRKITFRNLSFGSNKRTVYRILGKPYAEFKNPLISDHTILCYKFLLAGNKTRCEIHLYKNRFFLGVNTLDFNSNFQVVKNGLTEKYLGKVINSPDVVITDKLKNQIIVRENIMNYSIKYFSRETELYNQLICHIEKRENEIREQEREIIMKLKREL